MSRADDDTPPLVLDARAVGALLGVSAATVRRWWRERTLPHLPVRAGQRLRMSRGQLAAWLDGRRRT